MADRRARGAGPGDADRGPGDGLLQTVLEATPVGVVMVDGAGTIRLVNREVERLFGYARAELHGQPVEMLVPPRLHHQHVEQRTRFHARPSERNMGAGRDIVGRHRDGTEIPVEIGLKPVETDDGPCVLATIVDIRARKEAEHVLADREERFRQLAENIDEVFYVMDAQLRETLYINPAYETVFGRTVASLYADPTSFLDGMSDADRERVGAIIAQVQQGIDPGKIEFTITWPDGEERRVLAHAVPIRNERGEVYRLAGVALDITERRKAQEALHATEQRLLTLFESVNLVVLGLDREGRVDYVNPYLLRLTGYDRAEVFGGDWFDRFIPAAIREQMRATFAGLLASDLSEHFRNPIVTRSGEERMISWHNTVVRDTRGEPTGTLSIGEDVTEYEQLEARYRHAQKMEAVGRLAGGVAHDFNNLLTVITSYSDLLLPTFAAADDRREDVEAIRQAADSAATLTRQLLAFSRQQVFQPRVLALNDVVRNAERMLRRTIGEDITLTTVLAENVAPVRVDAGQIEQVLMNLAVNARDAMPGGGRLTIETDNVAVTDAHAGEGGPPGPGAYVLLAVTDSGVGMDEATRSRIFEPFYTTKESGKGTGLGLSTVYGIVEQSGGHIWVYSEPGLGTTFKIYLPQAEGEADDEEAPAGPVAGGTETVLLVEDAAAVRAVAAQTLKQGGYTVLEAPDGATALAMAQRHADPIHLLATDVVLPGINGRELAERLQAIRPEVAVLFMSGYTDDAITRAGLLERRVNYLQKPYSPDRLLRAVRTALDARESPPGATSA